MKNVQVTIAASLILLATAACRFGNAGSNKGSTVASASDSDTPAIATYLRGTWHSTACVAKGPNQFVVDRIDFSASDRLTLTSNIYKDSACTDYINYEYFNATYTLSDMSGPSTIHVKGSKSVGDFQISSESTNLTFVAAATNTGGFPSTDAPFVFSRSPQNVQEPTH